MSEDFDKTNPSLTFNDCQPNPIPKSDTLIHRSMVSQNSIPRASTLPDTASISIVVLGPDTACDPATLASVQAQTVAPAGVLVTPDRNAAFAAAQGEWILVVEAGDILHPGYAQACLDAAARCPDKAFFYTDSATPAPEYNAYHLLDANLIPSTAFIRKSAWEEAGPYDPHLAGREAAWEFWLRLAAMGFYGQRIPRSLFESNCPPHSPDPQTLAYIHSKHAVLYTPEGRGRMKALWAPVVSVVGNIAPDSQTIYDWNVIPAPDRSQVLASSVGTFMFTNGRPPDSHTAESSSLAIWGGRESIAMPDGVLAVSRRSLLETANVDSLRNSAERARLAPKDGAGKWSVRLADAGVLSLRSWTKRPVGTALRLIPLRMKEKVNLITRRPLFDLSFYLQFQPVSIRNIGVNVRRLHYLPKLGTRRRIAFVTPHLGPGGAENVLLDMARSLDRDANEIFVVATHSRDNRWAHRWEQLSDHVYDLASLVEPEALPSALYSLVLNWVMDTVVVQNSLVGYSVIPHWRKQQRDLRIVDLVHSVGGPWDMTSVTAPVASNIDTRIVISEAARKHLKALRAGGQDIRVIANGVDLEHFRPSEPPDDGVFHILFAARLDPVKRPLLLVDIAHALTRMNPSAAFRFIVAGDGREQYALRRRIRSAGVEHLFELRGYVEDMAPVHAQSDVVIVTSSNEGIPLTIVEAFASGRPVIASRAGAMEEIIDQGTGILIDKHGDEAAAFARALATLMGQPDLRRRMGAEARRRVEMSFDRRRSLQLYRDALEVAPTRC